MRRVVVFTVPKLAQRPVLGGECCAVPGKWLIEDGLSRVPGVEGVAADDELGLVHVSFRPDETTLALIGEELERMESPPTGAVLLERVLCCSEVRASTKLTTGLRAQRWHQPQRFPREKCEGSEDKAQRRDAD